MGRVGVGNMGRVGVGEHGESEEMWKIFTSILFLLPSSFFLLLFDRMSFVESFEALSVAHEPPVPRLVTNSLAIVFGERQFKAKCCCISF